MGLFGFGDSKSIGRVDTVISQDASIRGSYSSKYGIRVDGEIFGNVAAEDGIVVGEKGMIRGNLVAKSIFVSGKVKGNITAYQRVELEHTAQIQGDISTPVLIVEEGAAFEGNCQMEEAGKVVDMPKARES